jgi:hypothetical protein
VPNGAYEVRFRLYTTADQDAGEICDDVFPNSCQWEETQLVETEGGFLTAKLGSVVPFPQGLFDFDELWLGVRISQKQCDGSGTACVDDDDCDGVESCIWVPDSEMTPRQELGGVPYAQRELSDSVVLLGVYNASFPAHPPPPPECPTPDVRSFDLTWTEPPDLLEVLIIGSGGYGDFTPVIMEDGSSVRCHDPDSVQLDVLWFTYNGRYQIIPFHPNTATCMGGRESAAYAWGEAMPAGWYDDGFELRMEGCSYEVSTKFKIFVYGHYERRFQGSP